LSARASDRQHRYSDQSMRLGQSHCLKKTFLSGSCMDSPYNLMIVISLNGLRLSWDLQNESSLMMTGFHRVKSSACFTRIDTNWIISISFHSMSQKEEINCMASHCLDWKNTVN